MRTVLAAFVAVSLMSAAGCGSADDDTGDDLVEGGVTIGKPPRTGGKPAKGSGGNAAKDGGGTSIDDDGGPATDDGGAAITDAGNSGDNSDSGDTTTTDAADAAVIADGGKVPTVMYEYDGDFPSADKLPTAKGECPTFAGDGDYLFNVQGGRQVLIAVDASKATASGDGGPVIFYWHGTNTNPLEALFALGEAALGDVKNQGGLVAGFYSTMNHPDKGECEECSSGTVNGVWFREDFNLADEVLACAIAQLHIDTRRIHASGMSAGGLQTAAMLYARSNYLASVAPYSGGVLSARTPQDPMNNVAAMIFHGTYDADFVGLHFYSTSKVLFDDIKERGGFAIDCNHGQGHIVPAEGGPAVWRFFQTHPYETASPWATMLPADLPPYCSLAFAEE